MIYWQLFLSFFKVGLFCFGGAFGMIPLIEQTVVTERAWMNETTFLDFLGVCESTPGPIAVNLATYIGSDQAGLLGSLVATLGVVLPSFLIILLIATVLKHLTENRYFKGFLRGVQPVVVGLILSTGLILLLKTVGLLGENAFDWISVVLFALVVGIFFAVKALFKKKLSAVQLILISAALGILSGFLR